MFMRLIFPCGLSFLNELHNMMRIDLISDIACPWCAVGVASFEKALQELGSEFKYELHFQPFELILTCPRKARSLVSFTKIWHE